MTSFKSANQSSQQSKLSGNSLERKALHIALVTSNNLSQLPKTVVTLVLLGEAILLSLVQTGWVGSAIYLGFAASDWLLLWLLPRKQISFGPVEPSLLAITSLRWALAIAGGVLASWINLPKDLWLVLLTICYGIISAVSIYGVAVEPFRLTVTKMTLSSPKLAKLDEHVPPVRILQMGDLHIERLTRREHNLLARITSLAPDVILLTGDYLNLSYVYDQTALKETREFLSQLDAPFGVYAVSGSLPVDPPAIIEKLFDGLDNIRLLRNEHVILNVRGQYFCVAGIVCSHDPTIDASRLQESLVNAPRGIYTIALSHSPDLIPKIDGTDVDLILAGHTHGGQIRLPFYGALITSSIYGKRYEMGYYQEGQTRLYVSRGVGMEGLGAPRARFLCPPEIVLWTWR